MCQGRGVRASMKVLAKIEARVRVWISLGKHCHCHRYASHLGIKSCSSWWLYKHLRGRAALALALPSSRNLRHCSLQRTTHGNPPSIRRMGCHSDICSTLPTLFSLNSLTVLLLGGWYLEVLLQHKWGGSQIQGWVGQTWRNHRPTTLILMLMHMAASSWALRCISLYSHHLFNLLRKDTGLKKSQCVKNCDFCRRRKRSYRAAAAFCFRVIIFAFYTRMAELCCVAMPTLLLLSSSSSDSLPLRQPGSCRKEEERRIYISLTLARPSDASLLLAPAGPLEWTAFKDGVEKEHGREAVEGWSSVNYSHTDWWPLWPGCNTGGWLRISNPSASREKNVSAWRCHPVWPPACTLLTFTESTY